MTELGRRTLISASGLTALAALTGCSAKQPAPATGGTAPASEGSPDMTAVRTPSTQQGTLLVYFSRAGENYWNGGRRDLKIGNTKIVAQLITEHVDCDTYEILAENPYPRAYTPTVERNQREQNTDARPRINGSLPDLSRYSTILLGTPVWNTRAPMIIRTFLDQADALAEKTIYPFLTYAVGQGSVFDDYRDFCPEATLKNGLAIRGEDARDAASQIEPWLAETSLIRGPRWGNRQDSENPDALNNMSSP